MAERYDAFLSYARADDKSFVRNLYEHLIKKGFKIWWDHEMMPNRGETFLREIQRAIDKSERLIAVIGPAALKSQYVRDEWDYAQLVSKVVIPILRMGESLDEVPSDFRRDDYTLIPSELSSFHCPDFRTSRPQEEALDELDRILRQKVIEPGKPHYIPPRPPNFLPRREVLNQIGKALLADAFQPVVIDGASKQTVVLHGMPGTGKSVIAAAFASSISIRRSFTDGVIWLNIGQDPDLLVQLSLLGRALEDGTDHYVKLKDAETRLEELLRDKRCLIVLDDVWYAHHVEPIWNTLGSRCRLLITTRDAGIATSLGAQECHLNELSEEAALSLMSQWVETPMNELPKVADDITKECGNLPLAIALCGAMIRDKTPWMDLLDALHDADLSFLEHDLPNYEYPHVMRALQTSVEFLAHDRPEVPVRYTELTVFAASKRIPESAVLTLWCSNENLDERNARKLLAEMDRKALLQLEGEPPDRIISLHALEWDYVRAKATDVRTLHVKLLDAYKAKCPDGWAGGPKDGYFFEYIPYHLLKAGQEDEVFGLLLDINWLEAKLQATDVNRLIGDYELLSRPSLSPVKQALLKGAHILTRDKSQLCNQLLGRLDLKRVPLVTKLLDQAPSYRRRPWLQLLSPSLTPAQESLLRTISTYPKRPSCIALIRGRSNKNTHAAVGCIDGSIMIWDVENGNLVRCIKGHEECVNAIAVVPSTDLFLSACGSGFAVSAKERLIKLWNFTTGELIRILDGHAEAVLALAVTPNGCYAIAGAGRRASDSKDSSITVWEISSGRLIHRLEGHEQLVSGLAVTPDGTRIVSVSADATWRVWHLDSGRQERAVHVKGFLRLPGEDLTTVCITPDGNHIITAGTSAKIRVWDLKSGEQLHELGKYSTVNQLTLTPDGKRLICALDNHSVQVFNLETMQESMLLKGHSGEVVGVTAAEDHIAISIGEDCELKLWDLHSPESLTEQPGHKDRVIDVQIAPGGRLALSAAADTQLKIWEMESATEQFTFTKHKSPVTSVAISLDGKWAVSIATWFMGPYEEVLRGWDLEHGIEKFVLVGHKGSVNSVAITPDGSRIVSGGSDGTFRIWSSNTGSELFCLAHKGSITCVCVFPDNRLAASLAMGHGRQSVKLWDILTGNEITTLFEGESTIGVIGRDDYLYPLGFMAATHNGSRMLFITDAFEVWSVKNYERIYSLPIKEYATSLIPLPDNQRALFTLADGRLIVYDYEKAKILADRQAHNGVAWDAAVTADGNFAVTCGSDAAVRYWDLTQYREIASFVADGVVRTCDISGDGIAVLAGTALGQLHFLRVWRQGEL